MRVVHVMHSTYPDVTGASIRSRYVVETQADLGLSPVVVSSPFQPPVDPANRDGVEWLRDIPYYRTFDPSYDHRFMVPRKSLATRARKLTALGSFTRRVRRIALEQRADVLHGHSLFFCGLAAVFAARSLGVPSVYEVRSLIEDGLVSEGGTSRRGMLYRGYRWFDNLTVRIATHVVTISEGLRRDLIERGVAAQRITVVGNGVDVDRQTPAPPRDAALQAQLGFPPNAFVLGYIGTLMAYENVDSAIDCVAALAREHTDLRLLIIGDGNARAALVARAHALAVADRIQFVPRVAHDEIGPYYGLVDLFVLPRRPTRLTDLVTPLKPLEIMARSKALLASNCGGHRELICDGENGLLFDAASADGLAGAVRSAYENRATLPALGRRARRWVAAHRSWRAAVAPSLAMYERLAGRAGGARAAATIAAPIERRPSQQEGGV